MEQNKPATTGNLKVSENVVSTIVRQVISDMDGVGELAAPPVTAKEALLFSGVAKPIKITLNGDVAVIDLGVVLKIGYRVKDLAEKIQNTVKEEVQNMTGITVSAVNVFVVGAVKDNAEQS